MKQEPLNVLAFMAHPDDAEFLCAGTLARLHQLGAQITIATMTAGDGGSAELPNETIAKIRLAEARAAAAILQAEYWCAEQEDFFVSFSKSALQRTIEIIRRAQPHVVFTHSPQDYMTDHEQTSLLVRAGCFAAPAPNAHTGYEQGQSVIQHIPHLYYADAIEGKDIFGQPLEVDFYIDISTAFSIKSQMLECHSSQRQWLFQQHGMDHYLESMRQWSAHRGQQAGTAYAEGFRQHRGHAYPQTNLLADLLNS